MKHLLFVDDELRVLQGVERRLRSMRHEWHMTFVDSGPKALEFMASQPVDVIVSDMMMPGMDGAQLLAEVTKRHPDTVRLVLSGHSDKEAVMQLVGPAHQYLSKPCNTEELQTAISRTLAIRDLLCNAQLKRLVSRLRSLPTLPTLHQRLTRELLAETPSLANICEAVSHDIGMTAKILQLVNSAFFGLAQPVTNVAEAVSYLGLNTLSALVLSLQVFSQFEQRGIHHFSIEALADHCWTTGILARRIATLEKATRLLEDQCFLAGMLHDAGSLILASSLPDEFNQIVTGAEQQGHPLWHEEAARLGTTHAEIGAYLLGLWGLPNVVVEAVAFHHHPSKSQASGFSPLAAVHVADWCAHNNYPSSPEFHPAMLDLHWLKAAGLRERLEDWERECQRSPTQ